MESFRIIDPEGVECRKRPRLKRRRYDKVKCDHRSNKFSNLSNWLVEGLKNHFFFFTFIYNRKFRDYADGLDELVQLIKPNVCQQTRMML